MHTVQHRPLFSQCFIGIECRTMICFSYPFNQILNVSIQSPLNEAEDL